MNLVAAEESMVGGKKNVILCFILKDRCSIFICIFRVLKGTIMCN